MTEKLFTVEKCGLKGYGIGTHAIRFTPAKKQNADGSTTYGLSFHCLIAGDMLSDAENVLQEVADVLNESGRWSE